MSLISRVYVDSQPAFVIAAVGWFLFVLTSCVVGRGPLTFRKELLRSAVMAIISSFAKRPGISPVISTEFITSRKTLNKNKNNNNNNKNNKNNNKNKNKNKINAASKGGKGYG